MRAIWRGAVSFGLVNVPVRLFAATEEHDIRFHQIHKADGGRIKYKRVCSIDGEEVAYGDIGKGYESEDGRVVQLTDADFDNLPVATGREIDVVEFVPREQVDPILFDRSYYLEPESKAAKPYALLREALVKTDRIAVVKVALRQKETLAVLRVRDKAILLQTMLWPDEVRSADFDILDDDIELRPQELNMASSLVESMAADFDPSEFVDDYQKAVVELIDSKLESGDSDEPAEPVKRSDRSSGEVIDLLTALQRSVDAARKGRSPATSEDGSADSGSATKPATKAASKKVPAKKAAAKSAAKKVPAKKAPAKKAAAAKAPAKKSA